mgnify:CR=1 FL=1
MQIYFDNFEKRYILLSALVFSIGLAHKITFVYSILPILLLIGILIWKNKKKINNNKFYILEEKYHGENYLNKISRVCKDRKSVV